MKVVIPTLNEIFPELKQDQIVKQQTSLLTAILELNKTIQSFQPNNSELAAENLDLKQELATVKGQCSELSEELEKQDREIEALNKELDEADDSSAKTQELQREVAYHVNRFNTLQEHYKNSTSYNEELHKKIKAMEVQMATINLSAPKGFKSWEDAATTERLHHNQTKTELANRLEEVASLKLKLERFQKLFKEALGQ